MIKVILTQPNQFSAFVDLGLDTMALEMGDTVAVTVGRAHGQDGVSITTVERLTPTQLVLAGRPGRYRRSDGSLVGDRWSRRIFPVDHPLIVAGRQRQVMAGLKTLVLKQIDLGTERGVTVQDRIDAVGEISAAATAAERHIRELERRAEAFEAAHAAVRSGG